MDNLNDLLKGFDSKGLTGMIDKMQNIQKQHVTIGSITFDKTELKRAEPVKHNGLNCTKITWKDDTTSILEVSKLQFDKEFNI